MWQLRWCGTFVGVKILLPKQVSFLAVLPCYHITCLSSYRRAGVPAMQYEVLYVFSHWPILLNSSFFLPRWWVKQFHTVGINLDSKKSWFGKPAFNGKIYGGEEQRRDKGDSDIQLDRLVAKKRRKTTSGEDTSEGKRQRIKEWHECQHQMLCMYITTTWERSTLGWVSLSISTRLSFGKRVLSRFMHLNAIWSSLWG